MTRPILTALALISLAACSQQPEAGGETADDFASRVGGAPGQPSAAAQPGSTTPAEGAVAQPAPKPASTGLALDPGAEACQAPAARNFLNQRDTPELRQQIMQAATGASEIRFLPPGTADRIGTRKDRLNVMIDTTGTIRDLRCG